MDPLEQTLMKFEFKIQPFSCEIINFKMSPANWQPFCLGIHVLIPASEAVNESWGPWITIETAAEYSGVQDRCHCQQF